MSNKSIKLPSELYVGFTLENSSSWDRISGSYKTQGSIMKATMTPYGTDSASKKRMATVDRYSNKDIESTTMANDTQAGFKIKHVVRQYGGQDWWRITDPRGFQLEISSDNVSRILADCTIENSEIQEPCLWGRDGGANVLIPITSHVYETAKENQARVDKKIGLKDIKIGDTVMLHSGEETTYLGVVWLYEKTKSWSYRSYGRNNPGDGIEDNLGWVRKHCFKRTVRWNQKDELYFPSSQKISEVTRSKDISEEERQTTIKQLLDSKQFDYPWGRIVTDFSLTKQKVYKKPK